MVKRYQRILEITEGAKESVKRGDFDGLSQAVEEREAVMNSLSQDSHVKIGEGQRIKAMLEAVQKMDEEIMTSLSSRMEKDMKAMNDGKKESRALLAYAKTLGRHRRKR